MLATPPPKEHERHAKGLWWKCRMVNICHWIQPIVVLTGLLGPSVDRCGFSSLCDLLAVQQTLVVTDKVSFREASPFSVKIRKEVVVNSFCPGCFLSANPSPLPASRLQFALAGEDSRYKRVFFPLHCKTNCGFMVL